MTQADAPPTARTYDAFISYRTASSGRQAKQLSRALFTLGKRHLESRTLHVFLDTAALTAGSLDRGIEQALTHSRALIVLLDRTTSDSPWVSQEIEYWLAHGGTADRLFLVRTDPQLDLTWDRGSGAFQKPAHLPVPLRTLFTEEQKYFDIPSARSVDEGSLAGLYAAVLGINTEALLLEESRYQQKRRRRTRVVMTVLIILTVVAVSAGVVAYRQSRLSAESARRATGEAAAAEALLTLPYSYPDAIDQVLEASRMSASQSVRSALIAVATKNGAHLTTFDWDSAATGRTATGMAFDADGRRLFAWGSARSADESHLSVWSVTNGEMQVNRDIDIPSLSGLVAVDAIGYVGCSEGRAVLLGRRALDWTWLGDADQGVVPRACRTQEFAGGALVESQSSTGEPTVAFVSYTGERFVFPGSRLGRLNPASSSAALPSPGGLVLVSARGFSRVEMPGGIEIRSISDDGSVLLRSAEGWWRASQLPDGKQARVVPLSVPVDAEAVALHPTYGEPTRGYAWISSSGRVGWSGSRATVVLEDHSDPLETGDEPYSFRADIVANGLDAFVATIGGTAYAVTSPKFGYGWRTKMLTSELRTPDGPDVSPIEEYCDSGGLVGLPDDRWIVRDDLLDESVIEAESTDATAVDCTLVDPGPPLAINGEKVSEGGSLGGKVVLPTRNRGLVAIFRPGTVTPVLLTGGHVENPWRVDIKDPVAASILGERRVISNFDGVWVENSSGKRSRLSDDYPNAITIGPDGRQGVMRAVSPDGDVVKLFQQGQSTDLDDACDVGKVQYLPGKDFARDLKDAERQTPAIRVDRDTWMDCRTGENFEFDPDVTVQQFEIGQTRARIQWRESSGGAVHQRLMLWNPGDDESADFRDLPAVKVLPDKGARYWLDDRSSHVLATNPASGIVLSWEWQDGEWVPRRTLQATFGSVRAAGWSQDGSLAIVVGPRGEFELYDTGTGRRLLADVKGGQFSDTKPARLFVTESAGLLSVHIKDNARGEYPVQQRIQIPTGMDRLRELLCVIHPAAACESTN